MKKVLKIIGIVLVAIIIIGFIALSSCTGCELLCLHEA